MYPGQRQEGDCIAWGCFALTAISEVLRRNPLLSLVVQWILLPVAWFYLGWATQKRQRAKRAKYRRPHVSFEKRWRCAQRQKWRCNMCKKILPVHAELDHVVPLFMAGSNELSNLQLLCPNCHAEKSSNERKYL